MRVTRRNTTESSNDCFQKTKAKTPLWSDRKEYLTKGMEER